MEVNVPGTAWFPARLHLMRPNKPTDKIVPITKRAENRLFIFIIFYFILFFHENHEVLSCNWPAQRLPTQGLIFDSCFL